MVGISALNIIIFASVIIVAFVSLFAYRMAQGRHTVFIIDNHRNIRSFPDGRVIDSGRAIEFNKGKSRCDIDDNVFSGSNGKKHIYLVWKVRPNVYAPLNPSKEIEDIQLNFPSVPELQIVENSLKHSQKRFNRAWEDFFKPVVLNGMAIGLAVLMVIFSTQYAKNITSQQVDVCEALSNQFGQAVDELARTNNLNEQIQSRDSASNNQQRRVVDQDSQTGSGG